MENFMKEFQDVTCFNEAVNELTTEAGNLLEVVRVYSDKIKEMELNLGELRAHFPFKKLIKSEKRPSHLIPAKPEHEQQCVGSLHGYYKQSHWFLSWERDENCKDKRFRLFLIEEQNEIIVFDYDEALYQEAKIKSTPIFKKAFADTNLKIKLQFSDCLLQFIYEYADFLKRSRNIIEDGVPF